MNRRHFFTMMAAPVLLGYKLTASIKGTTTTVKDTGFAKLYQQIAENLERRIPTLPVNARYDMDGAVTVLLEEVRRAGFVNDHDGDRYTHKVAGRYQILRAVDPNNFLPKVAVVLYPSRTDFNNGMMFKVEYRIA
jgi:hypothetical protein